MQAFAALVLPALMKMGAPDIRLTIKRKNRRIRILGFRDNGEFLRTIKNQPVPNKLMAKAAETEVKQNASGGSRAV